MIWRYRDPKTGSTVACPAPTLQWNCCNMIKYKLNSKLLGFSNNIPLDWLIEAFGIDAVKSKKNIKVQLDYADNNMEFETNHTIAGNLVIYEFDAVNHMATVKFSQEMGITDWQLDDYFTSQSYNGILMYNSLNETTRKNSDYFYPSPRRITFTDTPYNKAFEGMPVGVKMRGFLNRMGVGTAELDDKFKGHGILLSKKLENPVPLYTDYAVGGNRQPVSYCAGCQFTWNNTTGNYNRWWSKESFHWYSTGNCYTYMPDVCESMVSDDVYAMRQTPFFGNTSIQGCSWSDNLTLSNTAPQALLLEPFTTNNPDQYGDYQFFQGKVSFNVLSSYNTFQMRNTQAFYLGILPNGTYELVIQYKFDTPTTDAPLPTANQGWLGFWIGKANEILNCSPDSIDIGSFHYLPTYTWFVDATKRNDELYYDVATRYKPIKMDGTYHELMRTDEGYNETYKITINSTDSPMNYFVVGMSHTFGARNIWSGASGILGTVNGFVQMLFRPIKAENIDKKDNYFIPNFGNIQQYKVRMSDLVNIEDSNTILESIMMMTESYFAFDVLGGGVNAYDITTMWKNRAYVESLTGIIPSKIDYVMPNVSRFTDVKSSDGKLIERIDLGLDIYGDAQSKADDVTINHKETALYGVATGDKMYSYVSDDGTPMSSCDYASIAKGMEDYIIVGLDEDNVFDSEGCYCASAEDTGDMLIPQKVQSGKTPKTYTPKELALFPCWTIKLSDLTIHKELVEQYFALEFTKQLSVAEFELICLSPNRVFEIEYYDIFDRDMKKAWFYLEKFTVKDNATFDFRFAHFPEQSAIKRLKNKHTEVK